MTHFITYIFGLTAGLLHLARGKDWSTHRVLTVALTYFFLCLGLTNIWDFINNIVSPAINPFQFEIAIVNLSFGALGLICVFFRQSFWLVTLLMYTFFSWGAAYAQCYSPNSSILLVLLDIAMPIIGIGLFIWHKVTKPEIKAMFSLMKDMQDMLKKSGININM